MTKTQLLNEYRHLCDEKHMTLDGIYSNSRKDEIQNAIDCLSCTDEALNKCLDIIREKYPNMHRVIATNGNFKRHSYNRLYVFNTAKSISQAKAE